jgi:uncharacterized protein
MLKRSAVLLSVLLVSLFSPALKLTSQGEATPNTISVTGNAEVRVVPDEVILILGIETVDKDLMVAKNQNDERVRKLFLLSNKLEIKPEHVQTDFIDIEPRYRDGYLQTDFVGFFVRKTVVITLKDTSKFEDLLTGALQSGANYVHGVEFRTTELRKHRDQARALAIQAAKEKASDLAKELGRTVVKPLTIREDQIGWWSSYRSWWGSRYSGAMAQNVVQSAGSSSAPSGDSAVALGQITVNASVFVTFALDAEAK